MSLYSPSILDGVDAIFDRWLALSHGPRVAHDPRVLIADVLDQIERNWAASRAKCGERVAAC